MESKCENGSDVHEHHHHHHKAACDDVEPSCSGPGYKSPEDAMKGPREKILYITCIQLDKTKPDYLSTVDVDPKSSTFLKVIHRLEMTNVGDEIHHSGWNVCSSCHDCPHLRRDKLLLPCLLSDRIYIVDMSKDPKAPVIHKTIEPLALYNLDLATPHTSHCLPSGEIMISTMGKPDGSAQGSFILLDVTKDFEVKGTWSPDKTSFGYDYWYQPYFDVLISSQWGAPKAFKAGFKLEDVKEGLYGTSLDVWSWKERKLVQTIDLGANGIMPLETRFLHNPKKAHGFVGCALSSTVFHFHQSDCGTKWEADEVISIPSLAVTGWVLSDMPGIMTDILLSMDDKYLYLSNWVHGDLRQYDVSNPVAPKLTGRVWIGGSIVKDGPVTVVGDPDGQPEQLYVKGRKIIGGPQMLQLSLDGKRLYVTTSLFSPWDRQFYPETMKTGSVLLQIDVDTEKGGLCINENFLVDFEKEPNGPVLAHEMRYPGGDCTSDIYLACP